MLQRRAVCARVLIPAAYERCLGCTPRPTLADFPAVNAYSSGVFVGAVGTCGRWIVRKRLVRDNGRCGSFIYQDFGLVTGGCV